MLTYEGPSHLVKTESVVSSLVLSDINVACKFIADQLSSHGFKLHHANFYFKIDRNGELVLLFATQIKTTPKFRQTTHHKEMELSIPPEELEPIISDPMILDEQFTFSDRDESIEASGPGIDRCSIC